MFQIWNLVFTALTSTSQIVDTSASAVADTAAAAMRFVTEGFNGTLEPSVRLIASSLNAWNLVVVGLLLLLVVVIRNQYPRQFRQLLSVPMGVTQTNQLLREWNPMNSFSGFAFLIIDLIISALFIQKVFVLVTGDLLLYNTFRAFCLILLFVAAFVLLRYLFLFLTGWLFRSKEVVVRQFAVSVSVCSIYTVAMLPLTLLFLYNTTRGVAYVGGVIFGVCLLIRFWNEIVETKVLSKYSTFYIFLYLCTLELIPVFLLLKAGFRYLSGFGIW